MNEEETQMAENKYYDLLGQKDFLESLYGFAYKRCNNSHDAEDLCSDIILSVIKAVNRIPEISHFHAFVWSIARRVYADFSGKRKIQSNTALSEPYSDEVTVKYENPCDDYIEQAYDAEMMQKIKREISFLSKIYRDVMVMYYLDEKSIADIAKALEISENSVKQRLFSARQSIKKEVNNMNSNDLTLKPIRIVWSGDGDPVKSHPYENAMRTFSQNVLYLCKDTARSAKEISEILNVPMLFVEEELEIQRNGSNGTDGLLKKFDNGKFISTFIMLDYEYYEEFRKVYAKNIGSFTKKLAAYIDTNKDRILHFPFLNEQTDLRFILWSLVTRMCWSMEGQLSRKILSKYYSNVELDKKDYYPFGIVIKPEENWSVNSYGCDGIDADNICGYTHVHLCNIYGIRKEAHFHCGLNISTSPQIQMTLRAIDGLDINTLEEKEKETAAKAIEAGYLKREGGKLLPKILVIPFEKSQDFYKLANDFYSEANEFAESITDEMYELVKKYLPKHLTGQVNKLISHTSCDFSSDVVEKCIEDGILYAPENRICAEGTIMVVTK